MNRLIYFFVLILFLIMIKKHIFMSEGFHPRHVSVNDSAAAAVSEAVAEAEEAEAVAVSEAVAEAVAVSEAVAAAEEETEAAEVAYITATETLDAVIRDSAIPTVIQAARLEAENKREILNVARATIGLPEVAPPPPPQLPDITSEEDVRQRVGVDHDVIRTVQNNDTQCCGVDIYDIELGNIGKCVTQHIKKSGEESNPMFVEWNDIDANSECKNPHRILSRTSNCNEIVTTNDSSIQTLLNLIKTPICERCDYLRYLQESESESTAEYDISYNDKHYIFQNRIACNLRRLTDTGESETINIGGHDFSIKTCGEPATTLPCD
jgi:hypothetical protein